MGYWTDEFLAPYEPTLLPVGDFAALIGDLMRYRLVTPAWTVIAGDLSANTELSYRSVVGGGYDERNPVGANVTCDELFHWDDGEDEEPAPWGHQHEYARILARGEGSDDVLTALQQSFYGDADVVVALRLDTENPSVKEHYGFSYRLAVFALAQVQRRPLFANTCADRTEGPTHPVQTYLSVAYKQGEQGPCPGLPQTVSEYLGRGLVFGATFG